MIRVNLLKAMGVSGVGTNISTSASSTSGAQIVSVDLRRVAGMKIVIILLFPVCLFVWEKVKLSTLHDEQTALQEKVSRIETETASFGSTAPRVAKANQLKERMKKEMEAITLISKDRLREVKSLDLIQTIISADQTSWLKSVRFEERSVNLVGYSMSDADFTGLMERFEQNGYFNNIQMKTKEVVENEKNGQTMKFDIVLNFGKQE